MSLKMIQIFIFKMNLIKMIILIKKKTILIESINSIEKDNSSKFFSYDYNGLKTINDNEKNEENNFIKEKEELDNKK